MIKRLKLLLKTAAVVKGGISNAVHTAEINDLHDWVFVLQSWLINPAVPSSSGDSSSGSSGSSGDSI